MKKLLAITLSISISISFSFLFTASYAQQMQYSRVKIYANHDQLIELAKAGINTSEGTVEPGHYLICDYSEKEIEKIKGYGLNYEILIKDVSRYYAERNKGKSRRQH